MMSNNTDNSSQSSDDDTLKKHAEVADFQKAADASYQGNEDLKNKIFLGCLGLAGMMISAAIVQLDGFAWEMYAAQTIMVMLFVFGLHALAVATSITALSNPLRPLPKWIQRRITRKKNKKYDPYTLYNFLIGIVKIIDMTCLCIIAVWSLYVAFSIWGKFPLF